MAKDEKPKGVRVTNRKAWHDYQITEVLECGIELTGTEVKSVRADGIKIEEAYARIMGDELFLVGCTIAPYKQAAPGMQHATSRNRKLFVHRRQLEKLKNHVKQKGKTLVPLTVYFTRGWAKCEIGIAEGKRHHDKRNDIKAKDHKRDMDRAMKGGR